MVSDAVNVAKERKQTRAEIRAAAQLKAGIYSVEAQDSHASNWVARFYFIAQSQQEAKQRLRDAGFHKKQLQAWWLPPWLPDDEPNPDGVRKLLAEHPTAWLRSDWPDEGWQPLEVLPATYQHPNIASLGRSNQTPR